MLVRKNHLNCSRRLPPIHEQIALQCAKNISKLAIALPKPRTPSGHVPVLVELRRKDEETVYRYQVNVPPDFEHWEDDVPTELEGPEFWSNPPIEPPPCPMHGRKPTGPPQMVMAQQAVHTLPQPQSLDNISTFTETAVSGAADEQIRAHFMATLYGQQRSPLEYAELWVKAKERPALEITELFLNENNEYVTTPPNRPPLNGIRYPIKAKSEPRAPLNGYKVPANRNGTRKLAELCLDQNGKYVMNGQEEPLNGLNGYKQVDSPQTNGFKLDQPESFMGLQRERQLRLQLKHELEQQKQLEQLREPHQQQQQQQLVTADTYPAVLHTLFRWNYCTLCRTTMRTVSNAVDHYSSRAHDRRVSSWLTHHCCGQGGGMPDDILQYLRTAGPAAFYCELCDLKLTSVMHAQQHFFGRRHRLVARHISKPNGEGYYDQEGHWVRTDTKWLMCALCEVSITSESQMAMHMAGARHRRRVHTNCASMRLPFNDSHMFRVRPNGVLAPLNPVGYYMVTNCSKKEEHKLPDMSYVCEVCNVMLNHLKSVKQHEEGRMHKRKMQRFTMLQAAANA